MLLHNQWNPVQSPFVPKGGTNNENASKTFISKGEKTQRTALGDVSNLKKNLNPVEKSQQSSFNVISKSSILQQKESAIKPRKIKRSTIDPPELTHIPYSLRSYEDPLLIDVDPKMICSSSIPFPSAFSGSTFSSCSEKTQPKEQFDLLDEYRIIGNDWVEDCLSEKDLNDLDLELNLPDLN